jgi:hypothetical protein
MGRLIFRVSLTVVVPIRFAPAEDLLHGSIAFNVWTPVNEDIVIDRHIILTIQSAVRWTLRVVGGEAEIEV